LSPLVARNDARLSKSHPTQILCNQWSKSPYLRYLSERERLGILGNRRRFTSNCELPTNWVDTVLPQYWEYPPSINAEYQSNYSAITNTSNPALEKTYLWNIQALNAQYLPTVVLDYNPDLWACNTQSWTNWPTSPSYILYANIAWNMTAWATISQELSSIPPRPKVRGFLAQALVKEVCHLKVANRPFLKSNE
jgi:hypothetical protein